MTDKDKKNLFLKHYANLPIGVRREIIAVIDGQPMTWNVCHNEIVNDTKLGTRILDYLINLELI